MQIIKHNPAAPVGWVMEALRLFRKNPWFLACVYFLAYGFWMLVYAVCNLIMMLAASSQSMVVVWLASAASLLIMLPWGLVICVFAYSGCRQADQHKQPILANALQVFKGASLATLFRLVMLYLIMAIPVSLISGVLVMLALPDSYVPGMTYTAQPGSENIPWFAFLLLLIAAYINFLLNFVFINAGVIASEARLDAIKSLSLSYRGIIVKNFLPLLMLNMVVIAVIILCVLFLAAVSGLIVGLSSFVINFGWSLILFAVVTIGSIICYLPYYVFYKRTFIKESSADTTAPQKTA